MRRVNDEVLPHKECVINGLLNMHVSGRLHFVSKIIIKKQVPAGDMRYFP
jgi:hypothetical protein